MNYQGLSPTTLEGIPRELLIDILLRLPYNDLKAVCANPASRYIHSVCNNILENRTFQERRQLESDTVDLVKNLVPLVPKDLVLRLYRQAESEIPNPDKRFDWIMRNDEVRFYVDRPLSWPDAILLTSHYNPKYSASEIALVLNKYYRVNQNSLAVRQATYELRNNMSGSTFSRNLYNRSPSGLRGRGGYRGRGQGRGGGRTSLRVLM